MENQEISDRVDRVFDEGYREGFRASIDHLYAYVQLDRLAAKSHTVNIEWNPHRVGRDTIEGYLQCIGIEVDASGWETLMVVQVYPSTSVGFEWYVGPTLEAALRGGPQ